MNTKVFFLGPMVSIVFSCHTVRKDKTSKHTDCISHVIAADDSLGKIRNTECETLPLSQTIVNYTHGMQKINMRNCPKAFIKVFQDHVNAWNAIRVVTDRYPEKRGEMHVLFKELEQSKDSVEFKKLQGNIWATWTEVERATKK
ncbi:MULTISPECIES: hypothetical protein [Flavobacterium]|uniref:hypothetical protein n=1 Tax=Flavobacterium TaxID=237 RepID=UPI001FCB5DD0|nr:MULTISPECIES: hypothetical protein [Flavobacterium]UOK43108.1 hypothetical protein LZF87_03060 [Flavobacterium enshiense]